MEYRFRYWQGNSDGERIQSVVLTTWNPTYSESKSLSNSPFQLKIGFEWKGFKGLKKSEIDLEEYKEAIPTGKDEF